ncbi:MAG: lytic transglycosylase domain-containing protein [Rickettsiales bacterium]
MRWRVVMMAGLLLMLGVMLGTARAQSPDFAQWQETFRTRALAEGIERATLDAAFDGIEIDEQVIKFDRKQPENTVTLEKYLANTISERRIRIGREMMAAHRETLKKISAQYGVQPEYIVALWGIESDYGNHPGNFSVVQSLATLAYEGRRADFFAKELISALKVIQQEQLVPAELTGSWAGAMGDCQFIPSTYLAFAVDGDGDGKRDIWNDKADVFASIANYLHGLGWDKTTGTVLGETGDAGHFKPAEASIEKPQTGEYWGKRGIRVTQFDPEQDRGFVVTPGGSQLLYAIYLDKAAEAENIPTLVTGNFKALLQWNRSRYFATAVGTLAGQIAGR